MECDKVPSSNRVNSRKLYGQPSANPEDINRILKLNDKVYYQIIKLNSLGAMDYKELQGVATYLGLPGNLKRKQLMALIVARKKGKEDIVDAILSEVNRERAGKKVVKYMQPPYAPFPPIVSTVPSYARHVDYTQLQNNACIYPFEMQVPVFRRSKMNHMTKRSRVSTQNTDEKQHLTFQSNDVGPSNSQQPRQGNYTIPLMKSSQMTNNYHEPQPKRFKGKNIEPHAKLYAKHRVSDKYRSNVSSTNSTPKNNMPSTSFGKYGYEFSPIPISYMDNPNQTNTATSNTATDTVNAEQSTPHEFSLIDNSTPVESCFLSTNDSCQNLWMESKPTSSKYKTELFYQPILTANMDKHVLPVYSDNSNNVVKSNNDDYLLLYDCSLKTTKTTYDHWNMQTSIYLGANTNYTLTYIYKHMYNTQETQPLFLYNGSIMTKEEQQSQFSVQSYTNPVTPFDTLCNIASSIIENTADRSAKLKSSLESTKPIIPNGDLDTLSNVAISRLDGQIDVDLEFDNILDIILGENEELIDDEKPVIASDAAGPARTAITSAGQPCQQVEPVDYSLKPKVYFPLLISDIDNHIQHYARYNTTRLAVSSPLMCSTFGYESSSTCFVYNSVAAMPGSGTHVCFSRPLHCIAHTYETHTEYTPKACVYMDANNLLESQHATHSNNVPDCCLLHPEYSLSYDMPKLYLRSIRSEYLAIKYSSNQLIPNIAYNMSEKNNYHSSQVYYNIMLPNENNNYIHPKLPTSNANYIELKPRLRNKQSSVQNSNMVDFEASIQPLTIDEEMLVYNSLDDIENIDFSINETYHQIMASQHNSQCVNTQITCPFLYTECYWFETMPLMPRHIRQMHPEKIVQKNKTEYIINFIQLAGLGDRGIKIVQEHNNHMYFISLCVKQLLIHITIQELCESVDQHTEKTKAKLIVKLQNGIKSWNGEVHSMHIPLSQLWTTESSLAMPAVLLRSQPSKYFRLYVEVSQ